jgi:di/tricarboxylate transporter
MSMKSWVMPTLLAAAIGIAGSVVPAAAGVKVGVLTCRVAAGVGLVLGSSKGVSCDYTPTGYKPEHYTGRISKLGVDVGFTTSGVIVWGVFAAHAGYSRYALAGHYGGATAEATIAVGLGANALVGGSGRSFALQPFSVSGQTGLGVAAGIAGLDLSPAR